MMAEFLTTLGRTSMQVSLLIAAILVVRLILGRHLTARWHCALWLLVCVKILLPWAPHSELSLAHWLPQWEPAALSTEASAPTVVGVQPTMVAVDAPSPRPIEPLVIAAPTPDQTDFTWLWLGGIWLVGAGWLFGHSQVKSVWSTKDGRLRCLPGWNCWMIAGPDWISAARCAWSPPGP